MLGSEEKRRIICGESFGLDEARRRRVVVGGRRPAGGHGREFVALDEWLADIGRMIIIIGV